MNNTTGSKKITEASVMLATATVLSLARLIELPYGGSVTIACMLPIIIVAYRHGLKWGLLTGLSFGVIQQLLGLNTLSYATTWQAVVAIIILDYLVAFMVAGFGGIFKKHMSQPLALLFGSLFICILRYICHVITGCTVWAGLSIPTSDAFIYSLSYNATYMIPETIVTFLIAYYVGSILDFNAETLRYYRAKSGRFLTSGGMGTMGYSIPAAIGAKKADPKKQVVAVCGDGSFQMSMNELATMMQHKNLSHQHILH